jgi:hypothetical protein
MKKLDKIKSTTRINFEPNEGELTLLSSNKSGVSSPSLSFLNTSADDVTEDMILQELASIISSILLKNLCQMNNSKKEQ